MTGTTRTMSLRVDDSRAPYLQVADDLRKAIVSRELTAGAKLPSVRELAAQYGVANMTVQNGLRLLRDEGLIYGVPGRGSFVRHHIQQNQTGQAEDAHSPEYMTFMQQLEAITDEVHRLAERVSQLEDAARPGTSRAPKRRR
jgi:DNA-binding GntR family transcriptional regulator